MWNLEDRVQIRVKDTGRGIQEDKLGVIFERFKQADELLTRRHEGSGIGLSLVKSLVEMHGGTISVKSKYQEGSEFIVELPVNMKTVQERDDRINDLASCEGIVQKIHVEFSDIYFHDAI